MNLLFKLGMLLAILLSSLFGQAQSKSDKVYDMFAGKDGVVNLSFSKSVIKPFEIFIDDDTKKVIYKMKKIRFMSYDEDKGKIDSKEVYSRITKELSAGNYFEIYPEEIDCDDCNLHSDSNDQIILIGHGNRVNMDEFHFVLEDNGNCILFSFFGDITIDDLRECGRFTKTTKELISM